MLSSALNPLTTHTLFDRAQLTVLFLFKQEKLHHGDDGAGLQHMCVGVKVVLGQHVVIAFESSLPWLLVKVLVHVAPAEAPPALGRHGRHCVMLVDDLFINVCRGSFG